MAVAKLPPDGALSGRLVVTRSGAGLTGILNPVRAAVLLFPVEIGYR
jgi:hypothetical protein